MSTHEQKKPEDLTLIFQDDELIKKKFKLNSEEAEQLKKIYIFAAEKHKTQTRKDSFKTPYIYHPIHVSLTLAEVNVNDLMTLSAALLHDTIEDTETTEQEIIDLFGKEIAAVVMECSDDKSLKKEVRKQLQIIHIEHASVSAKLVKLADKYSNLSNLHTNPPEKWSKSEIKGYFIWSYCVCKKAFGINKSQDEKLLKLFSDYGLEKYTKDELDS